MSNVSISDRGGNPVPSTTLVATDNTTIAGDGSGQRPLHVIGSSGGGQSYTSASGAPGSITIGMAVNQSNAFGVNALRANIVTPFSGIALNGNASNTNVTVQVDGIVTLTTAEWDAVVTGESGGLVQGQTYYVDTATAGFLTNAKPNTPNTFVTRVGIAISPTELELQPAAPLPVDGSSARPFGSTMNSGAALIGSPLFAASTDHVGPAEANTLLGAVCVGIAQAAAIAAAAVSVQSTGLVQLTTGQWDAVAGTTGGLAAGTPYYISSTAGGHIVSVRPASPNFVAQVGIALDATTMLLQISPPIAGV